MYLANLMLVSALGAPAAALSAAPTLPPTQTPAPGAEQAPLTLDEPLARDHCRGTLFHPSRQAPGVLRLGLGILFDAVDPQAMYGFELRVPHVALDARYGLGSGFSLTGHLDTVLVMNELTAGAGWSQYWGPWSLELGLEAGVYYGTLNEFGFKASYTAPMYVPRVVAGHSWKDLALALSVDAMMTFTQVVTVGDITERVGNDSSFLGARATLTVENKLERGGVWYYGIAAMFTKSYYQVWVLLPDSPEVLTYARVMAGYEF